MKGAGCGHDDVPIHEDADWPAMPWREMTSADLRTMARLTVESVEAFIACGEDVPESIRIDLSALISVDECPFDLRARAARLVRGFPN